MAEIQLAKQSDLEGLVKKDGLKVLSDKNYTLADQTKLKGIAEGANKYSLPSTLPASMITGLPSKLPADGGNASTVGGFSVKINVPANAKFTDTNTVYSNLSEFVNDKNFIDGAYDNTVSGLEATTIKGAIDELKSLIDGLESI